MRSVCPHAPCERLQGGLVAGGAAGGAITNLWKTQVTRNQEFNDYFNAFV